MLEIDGSLGEGGGQILRTSLSLSLLTGRAVSLKRIRANRPKPGLRPQHLKAVEAAAQVGKAEVTGAAKGAQSLRFFPRERIPGHYRIDIGTAGSAPLILQTLIYPLARAAKAASLKITGGTHVPWSPSFHYLDKQWLPFLRQIGFHAELMLEGAGYYPGGGGALTAQIRPSPVLQPLRLLGRGRLEKIECLSIVTGLPMQIAYRQAAQTRQRLQRFEDTMSVQCREIQGVGAGTMLLLLASFEGARACYFSLGRRGKPAERVADDAIDQLEAFLASDATVDEYLADQLLLPLVMVKGISEFSAPRMTPHLQTNLQVIQKFLPVRISSEDFPGRCKITIESQGYWD